MLAAPARSRLRRVLGVAGGLLVATALFLLTGELCARTFDVVDRLNGYTRLLFAAGDDPRVPYRLRPNVVTTFGSPVGIRVNALGFRGPELAPGPPPAGTDRVLVVGDSVVFGQGVPEDQVLTTRLAAALAARGRRVEVVNGGVPGFNAEADAALLAAVAPVVRPTQVVAALHLNDFDAPPRRDGLGILRRSGEGGWLDRSEFVVLLGWLWHWARGELWQQRIEQAAASPAAGAPGAFDPEAVDRAIAGQHRAFYAQPEPTGWGRITRGLTALHDEAARLGVPLLVVILPEGWQVDGSEATGEPQRRLLAACRDAGVRCLDPRPAFASHGGRLFLDVQHPNAEGHAILAEAVADALAPR